MKDWLRWFSRFAVETFRALRPFKPIWANLTLFVLAALPFVIPGFISTNRVHITRSTSEGTPVWESQSLPAPTVVTAVVVILLVCFAIGVAWVRTFALRIDRRVVKRDNNEYGVWVRNAGFS